MINPTDKKHRHDRMLMQAKFAGAGILSFTLASYYASIHMAIFALVASIVTVQCLHKLLPEQK